MGLAGIASAAPPASCAGKFVGTWTVRVLATGQTYPSVLSPSGIGHASCPACTPTGTWTCSGNTLTVFVNGISASQTLSADGRTLTGPCCVSTRVGRAPTVNEPKVATAKVGAPKPTANVREPKTATPKIALPEPKTASPTFSGERRSASCSTITGLGGDTSAATHCNTGNSLLAAARAVRAQNPRAAAETYKQAADAYRRAGDIELANTILQEALDAVASAANPPPASSIAPPVTSPNPNPTAPPGPQAALPSDQPSAVPGDDADACPPAAPQDGWQDASYCATASKSCVDRGSALYGDRCYPPPQPADNVVCPKGQTSGLNGSCAPKTSPKISFDALNTQAVAACGADLGPEQRRRCIADAKLGYLLAHDPNVRAACARITHHNVQLSCADTVYLYGPDMPWDDTLRGALRAGLNDVKLPGWVMRLTPRPAHAWEKLPNPCPPGQGVQPIPVREGGQGGWSCRPLVPFAQLADKPEAQPPSASADETADRIETKMQDVAALIARAVAPRAGARLAPKDRATCLAVAYRAVLAMMKGGSVPTPSMCTGIAAAARKEFASFARNAFYTGNRGLDALLAALDAYYQSSGDPFGADLGAPLPGMTGLEPDAANRRVIACVDAAADWQRAEHEKTLEAYKSHLARFGACDFATLAKTRIDQLEKKQ